MLYQHGHVVNYVNGKNFLFCDLCTHCYDFRGTTKEGIKNVGKGRRSYICPRCLERFSHARDLCYMERTTRLHNLCNWPQKNSARIMWMVGIV